MECPPRFGRFVAPCFWPPVHRTMLPTCTVRDAGYRRHALVCGLQCCQCSAECTGSAHSPCRSRSIRTPGCVGAHVTHTLFAAVCTCVPLAMMTPRHSSHVYMSTTWGARVSLPHFKLPTG